MGSSRKVVPAYLGGLSASVIAKWLEDQRGYEVATFPADLGQQEEIGSARMKAESVGVCKIV